MIGRLWRWLKGERRFTVYLADGNMIVRNVSEKQLGGMRRSIEKGQRWAKYAPIRWERED